MPLCCWRSYYWRAAGAVIVLADSVVVVGGVVVVFAEVVIVAEGVAVVLAAVAFIVDFEWFPESL